MNVKGISPGILIDISIERQGQRYGLHRVLISFNLREVDNNELVTGSQLKEVAMVIPVNRYRPILAGHNET